MPARVRARPPVHQGRDATSHPHLRTKLQAVGYGLLVPVFFVASGVRLNLQGLVSSPSALARVPVFLLALLLVRGLAAAPYLSTFGRRTTAAAALLQATTLPFIVTATQIGVATGQLTPVAAAALVCAGLLSVLVFPAAALTLLRGDSAQHRDAPPSGDVPTPGTVSPAPAAPPGWRIFHESFRNASQPRGTRLA